MYSRINTDAGEYVINVCLHSTCTLFRNQPLIKLNSLSKAPAAGVLTFLLLSFHRGENRSRRALSYYFKSSSQIVRMHFLLRARVGAKSLSGKYFSKIMIFREAKEIRGNFRQEAGKRKLSSPGRPYHNTAVDIF